MAVKRALNYIKNKGARAAVKRGLSKTIPKLLIEFPALNALPCELMIEPTSVCNLRCPLCSNKSLKRKHGGMSLENFKTVLDKAGPQVKKIVIGLTGEPLLNKEVWKMIKEARSRGIFVEMPSNLVLLDNYDMKEVIGADLNKLIVSMDGASEKTYKKYRVRGDFKRLVKNVKELCKAKEKAGAKNPEVVIQFLVMKHNKHEINSIEKLAREMHADVLSLKNTMLWTSLTKSKREKLAEKWLPEEEQYRILDKELKEVRGSPKVCPAVFDYCSVLWNGDLCLCCNDFEGEYLVGNILKQDFAEIFRSKKYNALRKAALEKTLPLCRECEISNGTYGGRSIRLKSENQ